MVYTEKLSLETEGEVNFYNITRMVQEVVPRSGVKNGIVNVFAPHATGIIVLTEYEPSLLNDIQKTLSRLIPEREGYMHPSNAHSHIRSIFLCPSKIIPLINGKLALGMWQSIVFIETDVSPRHRTLIVQIIGE